MRMFRSLLLAFAVVLMVGATTRFADSTILNELEKEGFLKTLYRN
jgi:hypothetical protein